MSSYHSSFTYHDINSAKDKGLIIAAFEPDEGLMDTFLSMDSIYEEYYDGTNRFDYGSRYNTSATIKITVIKNNGRDFSVSEIRSCLRWLTGIRTNSWLDMYVGDTIVYSFLAKCTNVQQQKMDARTIGLVLTFTSVSPWAYSPAETCFFQLGQLIFITEDGVIHTGETDKAIPFGYYEDDGVVCADNINENSCFNYYSDEGIVHFANGRPMDIENRSDDLYTYIYLDVDYANESGTRLSVINNTLGEKTVVDGLTKNEFVSISAKQFITSYTLDQNGEKVPRNIPFGDNFNFIWPRLCPGMNQFLVEANGRGVAQFTYRYPMKIGDCSMDISVYGSGIDCGDCGEVASYDTVKWEDITNTPTTIAGYGITDAYTMNEVDAMTEKIDEQALNNLLSNILG